MRICLLIVAALAAPLSAQPSFQLVDPVLSVDGRPVATVGAPLAQDAFGRLTIDVPGDGTFTVAGWPFEGARRAGQFDGRGLYFAVEGRSVRLASREPILSLAGSASAYATYTAAQDSAAAGPARLAVRVAGTPEQAPQPLARTAGSGPQSDSAASAPNEFDTGDTPEQPLSQRLSRQSAPPAARAPADARPTVASLPDVDWARLDNPDEVRRQLGMALPATASGDVWVLFQADRSGRVVRTAIVSPPSRLDAQAERIVQAMRFRPPIVDGQPTGLRSQVLVRFAP